MIYTCIGNHYHAHIHSYPFTNKNTHIPLPIHTHAYAFTSVDSLLLSCVHPGATSTHICSHVLTHILQRAHLNTAKCHTARRCLFIILWSQDCILKCWLKQNTSERGFSGETNKHMQTHTQIHTWAHYRTKHLVRVLVCAMYPGISAVVLCELFGEGASFDFFSCMSIE
jgi:hypothetical protein